MLIFLVVLGLLNVTLLSLFFVWLNVLHGELIILRGLFRQSGLPHAPRTPTP